MFLVIFILYLPAPVRFLNRSPHGIRHIIRIHNDMAFRVPGRTPYGLYQGSFRAQEAFLIRIQNSHQRNFRNIQPFPQQVYPYQNIEDVQTHIPDDFGAFQCINIRMQILYPYSHILHVGCQILRHPFRQSCHQYLMMPLCLLIYFRNQIINLTFHRPYVHLRVKQAGWPYNLFRPEQFMVAFVF